MAEAVILPLDLEHQIFELAALSRPVLIPNLMRVAWRVKLWLEPILYRALLFGVASTLRDGFPVCDLDTFALILRTKPKSLNAVRNVMATELGTEDMNNIIWACPNVENLFMTILDQLYSSTHPTPPGCDTLPLNHLYCNLNRIFDLTSMKPLGLPAFSHLTHLELFTDLRLGDESEDESFWRWSKLAKLPELAHLALNSTRHMNACLAALIILCALSQLMDGESVTMDLLTDDPRFVMMEVNHYIEDWQRRILVDRDYWVRADAFIAKRLSGEIERRNFFLEDTTLQRNGRGPEALNPLRRDTAGSPVSEAVPNHSGRLQ
ncbi:hypothetical protein B0H13DRAFT_1925367 [Mycena leptocephala]|nr:hypothetical protein B0H13DRAFT_1925367 [Mycena leptocephala]